MEENQTPLYQEPQNTKVMSVSDWLVTLLLMIIPLVNIVLLFVWAFSSTENKNRSNWAKAELILLAVVLVLYILFFIVFFVIAGNSF
ncbi:MAG: hypothetical protein PHD21_00545 [Flavobacteriales bacterium]|nr:hypothetical protein [Flavobacteriales bacterium]